MHALLHARPATFLAAHTELVRTALAYFYQVDQVLREIALLQARPATHLAAHTAPEGVR